MAENLTPPASEEDMDKAAPVSSDLSDAEDDDDDIGEIEPDHYWGDGKVPVFKPVSPTRTSRSCGAVPCAEQFCFYPCTYAD